MIALDTNVWVRYLVEDDPDQTERATRVIETTLDRDETIFVLIQLLEAPTGTSLRRKSLTNQRD